MVKETEAEQLQDEIIPMKVEIVKQKEPKKEYDIHGTNDSDEYQEIPDEKAITKMIEDEDF